MFAQLKRLGADSLLYAFMNIGTKLIAFIMLPVYTRMLGTEQYGQLYIVDNVMSILTFVVIFGTDSALAFFYFDTDDKDKRLAYVRNVMTFRISIVIVLVAAVLMTGPWLSLALFDSPNSVNLLYITLLTLLIDSVNIVTLMVMRFDFKTLKVVIFTFSKMALYAIFSYVFLKYLMQTPAGILWGRLLGTFIIFALMLPGSWRQLVPKIDKPLMKDLLKYATPLVPASLAFWVIANSSTFILKGFGTTADVAHYGAATRLASIITLITSAVQLAWRPYSMAQKDKPGSRVLFSKIYMILLIVGMIGIMSIATVIPYIIGILGEEYKGTYKYVAFISAAVFLNFYYLIISVGLFFTKKTAPISITFGFVAVVNLIMNLLLIPKFGIWGAVASYILAYMSAIFFIFRKSQQEYYVPVSFAKMAFLFINMLLALIGLVYIQEQAMGLVYYLLPWLYMAFIIGISRVDKDLRRKPTAEDLIMEEK